MWPFRDIIRHRVVKQVAAPPPITPEMQALGFHWERKIVWQRDEHLGDHKSLAWVEVCNTCGGNCGQCGTSLGMGIAPSMDCVIESLNR